MTIKASQSRDDTVHYKDISIGELFCHSWADQLVEEFVAVWLKMRDGSVCLNCDDTDPLVFWKDTEFSNVPNYKLYTGTITIENKKG